MNDLFCCFVDDTSACAQIFNFFSVSHNRLYQFSSRTVSSHFARQTTWHNRQIIAETRSYIFRQSPCCRQRSPFLCSLRYGFHLTHGGHVGCSNNSESLLGSWLYFIIQNLSDILLFFFYYQHSRLITWLQFMNKRLGLTTGLKKNDLIDLLLFSKWKPKKVCWDHP